MNKEYCINTPINLMGFSQKASCKAQGLIPRESKSFKGKFIKSPKYNQKKTKKNKGNKSKKIGKK